MNSKALIDRKIIHNLPKALQHYCSKKYGRVEEYHSINQNNNGDFLLGQLEIIQIIPYWQPDWTHVDIAEERKVIIRRKINDNSRSIEEFLKIRNKILIEVMRNQAINSYFRGSDAMDISSAWRVWLKAKIEQITGDKWNTTDCHDQEWRYYTFRFFLYNKHKGANIT